jgi:anion-transporting  ArsA/GET3 family ATPase
VFEEQLIVVSGKGGVGKTVIASAIASKSAASTPTVLVSFDAQLDHHPLFDVALGYEPVQAAPGLSVMRVDGLSAVREYVRRKVPFSRLYDAFLTSRMFRDFAEAAPGFEELMCLGKLNDLVNESDFGRVVFDAPSTGHMKTLVDVPAATLKAVLVGPLNHNARKIQDLLLDPERTRVVLAALPEEMAVREAMELGAFCRERRMAIGPVVVNQCVASRFSPEELRALSGLADPSPALRLAIDCAIAESELCASQQSAVAPLLEAGEPILTVPQCIDHEAPHLIEAVVAAMDGGVERG